MRKIPLPSDYFQRLQKSVKNVYEPNKSQNIKKNLIKKSPNVRSIYSMNDGRKSDTVYVGDPTAQDDRKTEDAYKTLFVGRISYETTEKQLRHEFEQFGAVKHIRLVEDEEGKSRGYAFIEYEHEADLKAAYKYADGKKIDGRRVVVDVERGRTVHEWRPRKFGGGIGETRKGGPGANVKYSGRYVER